LKPARSGKCTRIGVDGGDGALDSRPIDDGELIEFLGIRSATGTILQFEAVYWDPPGDGVSDGHRLLVRDHELSFRRQPEKAGDQRIETGRSAIR